MKRCIIIISGPLGEAEPLKKLIRTDDYIICVDGGYEHATALCAAPDIVIGDLDSLKSELPPSLPVLRFKKEKDETDTILAIDYALAQGYREMVLIGGLKGRLDHTYANFSALLHLHLGGGRGYFADADNEVYILIEGEIRLSRREGYYLSVFPFGQEALGVSERGVKYTLNGARLENSSPLGVSNEFTSEEAVISVEKGPILIILSKE
jgi:thiamine pyrophosphokinase